MTYPSEEEDGTNEPLSSLVNGTTEGWEDYNDDGDPDNGVKDFANQNACENAKKKLGDTHTCRSGQIVDIDKLDECTYPASDQDGAMACTASMNGAVSKYNGEQDPENISGDTELKEKVSADDVEKMCAENKEEFEESFEGAKVCDEDPQAVADIINRSYPDVTWLIAECTVTATAHGVADCPESPAPIRLD